MFNIGDVVEVLWHKKYFSAYVEKIFSKKIRVVYFVDNSYEDISKTDWQRIKHSNCKGSINTASDDSCSVLVSSDGIDWIECDADQCTDVVYGKGISERIKLRRSRIINDDGSLHPRKKKRVRIEVDEDDEGLVDMVDDQSRSSNKDIKTDKYNAVMKQDSENKKKCRNIVIGNLSEINKPTSSLNALVLDAEDMRFSNILLENGFKKENIDVANCGDLHTIREMQKLQRANVYAMFMGDFIDINAQNAKKYDIFYLDYCGMPGMIGKKNTPLDDIEKIFKKRLVANNARIAITVCARNNTKNRIKYEQAQIVKNYLVACAVNHGYIIKDGTQLFKYRDANSQTMFLVWADILDLNPDQTFYI